MLKKTFRLLFSFLFPLFFAQKAFSYIDEPYHETAFIGPPQTFYGLTYYSYYHTNRFWNQQGRKLPTFNQFRRHSYRLDMEYDINCRHALFMKGGYTMTEEQLNGRSRGLEDPEASWQYLFLRQVDSAFSGKLTTMIPIGQPKSSVRYGQWGIELKLLYSRCFDCMRHNCWVDTTLGYRLYAGFPSDQIRASFSLGTAINSFSWLISSTKLYYGLSNGDSKLRRNNICFNPNFRLLTTQIQGIVKIYEIFSLTAGGFLHLWGENSGAGGGFYNGLWIIF